MNRIVLAVGVVAVLAVAVLLSQSRPTVAEPTRDAVGIQAKVEARNPWTNLKVNTSPDQFQFAIVSDRTGGHRAKIFSQAVQRLNLLQPEFVLSVGDLIEGYTTKDETIQKEWKEFTDITAKFEMPFFYVPGNHDLVSKELNAEWEKRFGRKYYHFVYKNTLFLAVSSEETDTTGKTPRYAASLISAEQTAYFKKVLEDNKDVKWTMVFLHKPLWIDKDLEKNGWAAFEKLLDGRKMTAFCGHVHRYQKFTRNGNTYYQLATTGGGSRMRGVEYGEFDHIAWITMKADGPRIANVMLDGILPEDLKTPESEEPGVTRKLPKVLAAKGTITMDGQPVAGATVTFHRKQTTPTERWVFVADAWADKDGKFVPSTVAGFDGLPEGEYAVTVFLTKGGQYYDGEIAEKSLLPAKYADAKTTPLKVAFDGKGDILIDVKE